MNTLRFIDRRVGYFIAAGLILLATFLPALASAAQISERSVQLSSASAGANDVTYGVKFTPVVGAGAFVVDFCAETPILGGACTTPPGLDVDTPTSTSVGFTDVAELDENTVRVTGTMTAATEVNVEIAGIDNPDDAGTIYARIVTFEDATDANGYTSADPDAVGEHYDDGGVAIAITDTIGVSGSVLESLQFCVSGAAITEGNCGDAVSANLPLGDVVGDAHVLQPGELSTGNLYGQISTNAVGGAVVRLKSSTTGCGGLVRVGAANCNIKPVSTAPMTLANIESATDGLFGMLVATTTDPVTDASPEGAVQASGLYNATDYYLGWTDVTESTIGVTSLYGDAIFDTDDAPATDKNMMFTFGASAQNNTPAGNYAADLSMIATGTF